MADQQTKEGRAAASKPGSGSVLLVDSDSLALKALQMTLQGEGFTLFPTASAAEAVQVLAREDVDVVIAGAGTQGVDNGKFMTLVAKYEPTSYRIVLAAEQDMGHLHTMLVAGNISTVQPKPWADQRLVQVVQRGIGMRRLAAEQARLATLVTAQEDQLELLREQLDKVQTDRTQVLESTVQMLRLTNQELDASHDTLVQVLANMLALREGYDVAMAVERAELADILGDAMGMNEGSRRDLRRAAMLIGIGKVALEDRIVRTPRHLLEGGDTLRYRRHPLVGESVLIGVRALRDAAAWIRHQNERWDGAGYPDRLGQEEIPLGARILAVAGDFYALQRGAHVSRRLSREEARKHIMAQGGTAYDAAVLAAFDRALPGLVRDRRGEQLALPVDELQPGMVLARDLVTDDGVMLLRENLKVDLRLIQRLRYLDGSSERGLQVHVFNRGAVPRAVVAGV